MQYDVLVVGRPTCDVIFTGLSKWPEPGRENYASGLKVSAGGAFNFSAAASRLGLSVAFGGLIGNDVWSRFVREQFAGEGVSTEFLQVIDRPLPAVSVALNVDEDRGFITHESEAEECDCRLADHVVDMIARVDARHVHIHLVPWLERVAEAAAARGMSLSVDAWGWEPWLKSEGIWRLACLSDVLLMNDAEAITMTGAPDPGQALQKLRELCKCVVIKKGARGAVAVVDGEVLHSSTEPVKVVDATGAGDCFNAGFIYGLLHDLPAGVSLALGNLCGGSAVQAVGGYAGCPTEEGLLEAARARDVDLADLDPVRRP
ncbi:MAG: carbohydrate kinase family protein [Actinobacteria bacterium]|nr:carbohydrate kinase family protein [Actinomycetota bacterium]